MKSKDCCYESNSSPPLNDPSLLPNNGLNNHEGEKSTTSEDREGRQVDSESGQSDSESGQIDRDGLPIVLRKEKDNVLSIQ